LSRGLKGGEAPLTNSLPQFPIQITHTRVIRPTILLEEFLLVQVNRRLKALDKDQEELLRRALMGFPDKLVIAENQRINSARAVLMQRKAELEARIEQTKLNEANMESIERFCEIVRQNLGDFTFDDKRLALEALQIKVIVDGDSVNIEGAIPVGGDDIESTTPRCSESERVESIALSTHR